MRILVRLCARADCEYDVSYHSYIRGRIWRALRGTEYEEYHSKPVSLGFCYSNPMPWGDFKEDDIKHLVISSVDEELLAHIADDLVSNRKLNIGQMPFEVENVAPITEDVGEPGTTGVIETDTGVCVKFTPEECDEYGIDSRFSEADTYWQPEHTLEPFVDKVIDNLQWKHGRFGADYVPGPREADYGDLFESYMRMKNFCIPLTVTEGETHPFVLSKWQFDYTVKNDAHRKHLNLLLNTGIGEKNGYGLGFCSVKEDPWTPDAEA